VGCLRSFSGGASVLLGTLSEFAMAQAENGQNKSFTYDNKIQRISTPDFALMP